MCCNLLLQLIQSTPHTSHYLSNHARHTSSNNIYKRLLLDLFEYLCSLDKISFSETIHQYSWHERSAHIWWCSRYSYIDILNNWLKGSITIGFRMSHHFSIIFLATCCYNYLPGSSHFRFDFMIFLFSIYRLCKWLHRKNVPNMMTNITSLNKHNTIQEL